MQQWQLTNIKLFEETKEQVIQNYPSLHVVSENDVVFIRGNLAIESTDNKISIDEFLIEIEFPKDYPKGVPLLREVDGKIPKIADRHFNRNETACMFFRDARYLYYPEGSSIIFFIEKLVKPFFAWQIDYNLNKGKSTIGGWGHNQKGVLEFYSQILNTNNSKIVLKFLEYLTSKKVKKHWTCHCGSGKELNYCHLNNLLDLRSKIARGDALKSLMMLRYLR